MKKRIRFWLALAAGALPTLPALAGPDIGVSIGVSQPGFYGRVDIGGVGMAPVLVYPQPVIIAPPPRVVVQRQPIYLHVPPGHAKHWNKHCGYYGACGQPVYFVQEDWYRRHYSGAAPRRGYYDDRGDDGHRGGDRHRGHGKAKGHDKRD